MSSEIAQLTDNLLKKRLQEVIFMGYATFKLSQGFSLISSFEIYDSDHQELSLQGLQLGRGVFHLSQGFFNSF